MKANSLRVDSAAIESGEWIKDIPNCDDLEILARGYNSTAFKELRSTKIAALSAAQKKDDKIGERVFAECVVEAGLVDLRNYTDAAGDIPIDRARLMALEPDRAPFLEAIKLAMSRVSRIRSEDEAAAEKN